jgi:hypothetical protein
MKQETPEGRFFVSLLAVSETGFEPGSPNARSLATTAHCLYPASPANQERARRAIFIGCRQDESPRFAQCPVACDDGALFISCRSTFSAVKKAPLGRLALGLIVVTISPPIGIVRCGTAVRFEFAMKHGVVLFAHSAGRCGCLLLVGFV